MLMTVVDISPESRKGPEAIWRRYAKSITPSDMTTCNRHNTVVSSTINNNLTKRNNNLCLLMQVEPTTNKQ